MNSHHRPLVKNPADPQIATAVVELGLELLGYGEIRAASEVPKRHAVSVLP